MSRSVRSRMLLTRRKTKSHPIMIVDDSAPANVSAGTGGLDASIGFETLRAENSGSAMNDTMGFFANYTSAYVSSTHPFVHDA